MKQKYLILMPAIALIMAFNSNAKGKKHKKIHGFYKCQDISKDDRTTPCIVPIVINRKFQYYIIQNAELYHAVLNEMKYNSQRINWISDSVGIFTLGKRIK